MTLASKIVRKNLKISKFKNVAITRLLGSALPIYYVYYDSRRPNLMLSRAFVKAFPSMVNTFFDGKFGKKVHFTPLMELDNWNGSPNRGLFLGIDLSGKYFLKDKMFDESVQEDSYNTLVAGSVRDLLSLMEAGPNGKGFNVLDLLANAPSEINKVYLNIRKTDGDKKVILYDATYNNRRNTLLLTFRADPTWTKSATIYTKAANPAKRSFYTIRILFEDVDFHFPRGEITTLKRSDQLEFLQSMIDTGTVLLHSDDSSWLWQGHWENATDLGYAMNPYKGTKGKGIWSQRHSGEKVGITITKHIYQILQELIQPKTQKQIIKMINQKYGK